MREETPLISIIVPVYNAYRFLTECVESIENQTIDSRQVILVDDGSKDESGKLCDSLCQRYSDIIVIHKENGGAASARNAGLNIATGAYIGFVDSDDYLDSGMYEDLYQALVCEDAMMACCNWYRHMEINGKVSIEKVEKDRITERVRLSNQDAIKRLLLDQGITYSPCDKLFRRELFEGVRFPEGNLPSEDVPCIYQIISSCTSIVHTGKFLYYYRVSEGSVTQKKFEKRNMVILKYMIDIVQDIKMHYKQLSEAGEFALLQSAASTYNRILLSETDKEFKAERRELEKFFRKEMIQVIKNKYLVANAKLAYVLIGLGAYPFLIRLRRYE